MMNKLTAVLVVVVIGMSSLIGLNFAPRLARAEKKIVKLNEILDGVETRTEVTNKEFFDLRNLFDELVAKNPKLALDLLDVSIEQVEQGREPRGSFTDYVEPILREARQNGATPAEVNQRLDKILAMAKRGRFYSSFLHRVNDGGPGELESYFSELKAEFAER